jgi:hypothetical protein
LKHSYSTTDQQGEAIESRQEKSKFDLQDNVTRINAYAPEICQDEKGDWYISSVEWPHRDVSIARLVWE